MESGGNTGAGADEEFENLASPHTDSYNRLVVKDAAAPSSCCFVGWFYPVKATVSVDGVEYQWNSRAHRKFRYMCGPAKMHPKKWHHRINFLGWEPHIVTWWNVWIGEVANTLWVINGIYATWPEVGGSSSTMIGYVTGVVGAFLFIVTGYLGEYRTRIYRFVHTCENVKIYM